MSAHPQLWTETFGPAPFEPGSSSEVAPISPESVPPEDAPEYLTNQLITCIGNKRALLGPLRAAIETVRGRTGRDKLRMFDAFSGSGVVSRLFKRYASQLVVNDLEGYAAAVSDCFLTNRSTVDWVALRDTMASIESRFRSGRVPSGFLSELYAPVDASRIREGERVFYTPENAYRLDAYRQLLDEVSPAERALLLGPLLAAASVHANTAGVFKGFYKDRYSGRGKLGGSGADALARITKPIELCAPVLSRFECDYIVNQGDANSFAREAGPFDIAYLDPPYNQHPYGSNYFMLNLLVEYQRPDDISRVSGIPTSWRRSDYNVRAKSLPRLRSLVEDVDASFVVVSFNDEGFISPEEMLDTLTSVGTVTTQSQAYATFRGCRNLSARSANVTEHVYLVEKH